MPGLGAKGARALAWPPRRFPAGSRGHRVPTHFPQRGKWPGRPGCAGQTQKAPGTGGTLYPGRGSQGNPRGTTRFRRRLRPQCLWQGRAYNAATRPALLWGMPFRQGTQGPVCTPGPAPACTVRRLSGAGGPPSSSRHRLCSGNCAVLGRLQKIIAHRGRVCQGGGAGWGAQGGGIVKKSIKMDKWF